MCDEESTVGLVMNAIIDWPMSEVTASGRTWASVITALIANERWEEAIAGFVTMTIIDRSMSEVTI